MYYYKNNTLNMSDEKTEIIQNEVIQPKTEVKTFFTDKEAFSQIKNKISKYGDDVVNTLEQQYSKGLAYASEVQENFIEDIENQARELRGKIQNDNKIKDVLKDFNMDLKDAKNILKETLSGNTAWQEMNESEKEDLINNPAFIKKTLKEYKEQEKARNVNFVQYGNEKNEQGISRFEELSIKRGSKSGLSMRELSEYQKLLEIKYSKK